MKKYLYDSQIEELAEKYEVELLLMVGFLDGINDSLKTPNPIETMEEDTEVSLAFEPELLYIVVERPLGALCRLVAGNPVQQVAV